MSDAIQKEIDKLVHEHDIVLFMKGTPQLPQCGFSQQVASILDHYKIPYIAVNVLLDPDVRQGIKEYTEWPTIPQLYVKGKFVGGCDIVAEMHQSGELEDLLTPLKSAAES